MLFGVPVLDVLVDRHVAVAAGAHDERADDKDQPEEVQGRALGLAEFAEQERVDCLDNAPCEPLAAELGEDQGAEEGKAEREDRPGEDPHAELAEHPGRPERCSARPSQAAGTGQ